MTDKAKKPLIRADILKNKQSELLWYLLVFVVWAIWVFISSHNQTSRVSQIQISPFMLQLLRISIIVPYLFAWEAAMHAIIRLRRYARTIPDTHESSGFTCFYRGMVILLIGLALTAIVPSLKGVMHTWGRSTEILTIITNYAYVVPYFFAFWYFFRGAKHLNYRSRKPINKKFYIVYGVLISIFAYVWLDLIFTNPFRTASHDPAMPATYYLRDSLIVLTIVFPSMVAWLFGVMSVAELRSYCDQVKGVIYRSALQSFVKGVGGVIIGSILLQGLLSVGTSRLLQLGLGKILILVYMFLVIQILGFFFMAQGAYRLTKIESV